MFFRRIVIPEGLLFFKKGYAAGEGFVHLDEGRKVTVKKIFNGKVDVLE